MEPNASPVATPISTEAGMSRDRSRFFPLALTVGAAFLVAAVLHGCSQNRLTSPVDVEVGGANSAALAAKTQALLSTMTVQNRHTAELMAIEGVVGTATGFDAAGKPVVLVLTERALGNGRLPA